MSGVSREFSPLVCTRNNLKDIIGWVSDGNIVAIHTKTACRIFTKPELTAERLPRGGDGLLDLGAVRVIYVDCSSLEGLLDDGEWEWYIKNAHDAEEIRDGELRSLVVEQRHIPNKTHLKLGH